MNITVKQDNSRVELLGASGDNIIRRLYTLATTLSNTLHLEGNIRSSLGFGYLVDYLNSHYGPDFILTVDNRAIPFEDPNMITYLNSIGVGSNGVVTEADAIAATAVAGSRNTTVTKFNELKYFTNITESRGGWDGGSYGNARFQGWSALTEVDISNFTSIGQKSYSSLDCFQGCTRLVTVKASNKLTKIGIQAFLGCTSLQNITGLSGSIIVKRRAFEGCTNLLSTSFTNCTILLDSTAVSAFLQDSHLSSITMDDNTTAIGSYAFFQCSSLNTIKLNSNLVSFGELAFGLCTSLTSLKTTNNQRFRLNQILYMENSVFNGCTNLDFDVQYIPSWTEFARNSNSIKTNAEGNTYLDSPCNMFAGCTFKQLYVPNLIHTSAGGTYKDYLTAGSMFGGTGNNPNVTYQLMYFKNILYFYPGEFNNITCSAIVINTTTVPTFRNKYNLSDSYVLSSYELQKENNFDRWNSSNKIYVPDSAVNDYKTAAIWSKVADYIYPMSDLQQYATEADWEAAGKPTALIQEYIS